MESSGSALLWGSERAYAPDHGGRWEVGEGTPGDAAVASPGPAAQP